MGRASDSRKSDSASKKNAAAGLNDVLVPPANKYKNIPAGNGASAAKPKQAQPKAEVKKTAPAKAAAAPAAPKKKAKKSSGIAAGIAGAAVQKIFVHPEKPDAPAVTCTWFKNRGRFDMPMFTVIMILLVMGIVMMTSASYAYSYAEEGDSFSYAVKQIQGAAIGLIGMFFLSRLDYHALITPLSLKKKENGNGITFAKILLVVSLGLMVMVMFFGESVNDAKRWITIFGTQFQPSEILKIAVIVMVAYMLQRYYEVRRDSYYGFLRYWYVLIPALLMCVMQRHISALLIIFVIVYVMMFVGGCNRNCLVFLMVLGVLGMLALLFVFRYEYLWDRINGFIDPFSDIRGDTYQTYQSLLTIGSGGWFGLGLGNSRQKYFYLPESQNDFVFSIICEELGFFGAVTVILLFVLFIARGLYISAKARDKFGSFLALGITIQIGMQALMNIGVACNAIPNTGISLPFFSYGRTALIIQLVEMGLLLSVSKQSDT
ncbi:MAG: cell division protein FtsW [Eubacterium sp.]|nr:cell division protein FtsW [Eubacterium sp.]